MIDQLTELEKTHEELTTRLADPEVIADQEAFRNASKRLAEITPAVDLFRRFRSLEEELAATDEMLADLPKDDELFAMAQDETARLRRELPGPGTAILLRTPRSPQPPDHR